MPVIARCSCGASYTLKDEFAGQQLTCPKCNAVVQAPQLDPLFSANKYLLRQKHWAISEKYHVFNEAGAPILFVERPMFLGKQLFALFVAFAVMLVVIWIGSTIDSLNASEGTKTIAGIVVVLGVIAALLVAVALSPKRHVTFYKDESKRDRLLEVLQDKKWQFILFTYTIRDAQQKPLGYLRKNILTDIIRKRWECYGADGHEIFIATEDSLLLSMLRRFLGPLFGMLRTNFVFLAGDKVLGEFNRKFTILDHYVLDLTSDSQQTLDRRIALAVGVMLDTGEKR